MTKETQIIGLSPKAKQYLEDRGFQEKGAHPKPEARHLIQDDYNLDVYSLIHLRAFQTSQGEIVYEYVQDKSSDSKYFTALENEKGHPIKQTLWDGNFKEDDSLTGPSPKEINEVRYKEGYLIDVQPPKTSDSKFKEGDMVKALRTMEFEDGSKHLMGHIYSIDQTNISYFREVATLNEYEIVNE